MLNADGNPSLTLVPCTLSVPQKIPVYPCITCICLCYCHWQPPSYFIFFFPTKCLCILQNYSVSF